MMNCKNNFLHINASLMLHTFPKVCLIEHGLINLLKFVYHNVYSNYGLSKVFIFHAIVLFSVPNASRFRVLLGKITERLKDPRGLRRGVPYVRNATIIGARPLGLQRGVIRRVSSKHTCYLYLCFYAYAGLAYVCRKHQCDM